MEQQSAIELIARFTLWQAFGSYTFRDPLPRLGKREKIWYAYLYRMASRFDVSYSSLLWVRRSERGELTGRPHYHGLVFVPGRVPSQTLNRTMMWLWGHEIRKDVWGGIAKSQSRVYSFNPCLSGLEYITKALGVSTQSVEGGLYELNKFNGADLVLSDSFRRWLGEKSSTIYDKPSPRYRADDSGDPPEYCVEQPPAHARLTRSAAMAD